MKHKLHVTSMAGKGEHSLPVSYTIKEIFTNSCSWTWTFQLLAQLIFKKSPYLSDTIANCQETVIERYSVKKKYIIGNMLTFMSYLF